VSRAAAGSPPAPVDEDRCGAQGCATNSYAHRTGPRRDDQRRALLGAIGFKAGLFTLEVAGGLAFGSLALLADATHVAFDAVALVVAVIGVTLAGRPVTGRHSFGFARAEVMAAHFSALLMLVAGAMLVGEALARLRQPVPVDGAGLAAVAALGLAFNAGSAALLHRRQGNSLNMRAAFAHLATDAVGSLASLVAGLAILAWGWAWADPLASLATAALILGTGVRLLRESTEVFMEGTPRQLDPGQVRAAIRAVDGVLDVHHLHLWGLASDVPACSAHVVLAGHPSLGEAQRSSLAIKSRLAEQFELTNVTLEVEDSSAAQPTPGHPRGGRAATADPRAARDARMAHAAAATAPAAPGRPRPRRPHGPRPAAGRRPRPGRRRR
jgi:cobalt-zinc-cadmium efflux system protein